MRTLAVLLVASLAVAAAQEAPVRPPLLRRARPRPRIVPAFAAVAPAPPPPPPTTSAPPPAPAPVQEDYDDLLLDSEPPRPLRPAVVAPSPITGARFLGGARPAPGAAAAAALLAFPSLDEEAAVVARPRPAAPAARPRFPSPDEEGVVLARPRPAVPAVVAARPRFPSPDDEVGLVARPRPAVPAVGGRGRFPASLEEALRPRPVPAATPVPSRFATVNAAAVRPRPPPPPLPLPAAQEPAPARQRFSDVSATPALRARPAPPPQAPRVAAGASSGRRQRPVAQVLRKYREDHADGSITWGFENDDGTWKEETIGADCVVRGKYGYVDPDGNRREFSYQSGQPCDRDALNAAQEEQSPEQTLDVEEIVARARAARPPRPRAPRY